MWPVHTDIPGKLTYWEHSCWTQGCLKSSKQVHNLLSGRGQNGITLEHPCMNTLWRLQPRQKLMNSYHRSTELIGWEIRSETPQGSSRQHFQRIPENACHNLEWGDCWTCLPPVHSHFSPLCHRPRKPFLVESSTGLNLTPRPWPKSLAVCFDNNPAPPTAEKKQTSVYDWKKSAVENCKVHPNTPLKSDSSPRSLPASGHLISSGLKNMKRTCSLVLILLKFHLEQTWKNPCSSTQHSSEAWSYLDISGSVILIQEAEIRSFG